MNTDTDISTATKLEQQQNLGPGGQLRSAREALNLPVEQIASKLYLTMQLVYAIEDDKYQSMPENVFIRGYLRSYAKLVGVDENAIIADFDALGITDTPVKVSTQTIHQCKNNYNDKVLVWSSGLGIFVFILLVFIWWFSRSATVPQNVVTADKPLPLATTIQPAQANKTDKLLPLATTIQPAQANKTDKPLSLATTSQSAKTSKADKPLPLATTIQSAQASKAGKPLPFATTIQSAQANKVVLNALQKPAELQQQKIIRIQPLAKMTVAQDKKTTQNHVTVKKHSKSKGQSSHKFF